MTLLNNIDVKFLYRSPYGDYMAVWIHGRVDTFSLTMDVTNVPALLGGAAAPEDAERNIVAALYGGSRGLKVDIQWLTPQDAYALRESPDALAAIFTTEAKELT